MDGFYALHPFNQALVILCCTALIALFLYGSYHSWQQLDD
jgi:hypothetical protein